ncbi:hypothetical protein BS47DRAFT_1330098, partial [Hydnum rufescens UP504]
MLDSVPSVEDVQFHSAREYNVLVCLWQAENCRIQLSGVPYLVCTAATGSGETLTFWLPMLYQKGTTFIIVPLKNLGKQMADVAASLELTSASVTRDTLTKPLLKAIENREYRVITISPELIVDPRFWGLRKQKSWCEGVDQIIVDEFHCIDGWGGCRGEGFRPKYIELR